MWWCVCLKAGGPTDLVHGRPADARAGRPEEAAPSGFQGKDLCILNTTPEQPVRVLLRGGVNPRPKTRKPATDE